MAQDVICPGEDSMCMRKRWNSLFWGEMSYRYQLGLTGLSLSVQFSHSVVLDSLHPHGLQHISLSCPSPTPRDCSNSCPSISDANQTSHPLLSPSPQTSVFSASGSFPISQFFQSVGQSSTASASASVLPMNIQDWFSLGWTGWVSLLSKGLWRVFLNTTAQNHQFFGAQLSLCCNSCIHTWLLEKP